MSNREAVREFLESPGLLKRTRGLFAWVLRRTDVEDLAQEALMVLWEDADRVESPSRYLWGVVRLMCREYMSRRAQCINRTLPLDTCARLVVRDSLHASVEHRATLEDLMSGMGSAERECVGNMLEGVTALEATEGQGRAAFLHYNYRRRVTLQKLEARARKRRFYGLKGAMSDVHKRNRDDGHL